MNISTLLAAGVLLWTFGVGCQSDASRVDGECQVAPDIWVGEDGVRETRASLSDGPFKGHSTVSIPPGTGMVAIAEEEWPERIMLTLPVQEEAADGSTIFRIEEAGPIECILVLPSACTYDGLRLQVRRAFYISKTELTNAQRALIDDRHPVKYLDYRGYIEYMLSNAKKTGHADDNTLASLRRYLEHPDFPALMQGPCEAARLSSNLRFTGLVVRAPTVAEWLTAALAGSSHKYYWGDELTPEHVNWSGWEMDRDGIAKMAASDKGPTNSSGLIHVIGNAAELVIPSDEERVAFRRRFGPMSSGDARDRGRGLLMVAGTGLSMGGSVATMGYGAASTRQAVEQFVKTTTEWRQMLILGEISEHQEWKLWRNYDTGLRLVVELPTPE